jgi:WD40 repeat protein
MLQISSTESIIYLACDNLNVYAHQLRDISLKKVMTHKKKISAMALAQDKFLITGDVVGVIYIWNLMSGSEDPTLKTFDLHKDEGAITNLVAIQRPLSLFGLTANM